MPAVALLVAQLLLNFAAREEPAVFRFGVGRIPGAIGAAILPAALSRRVYI
jgi:hypothetical protein